MAAIWDGVVRCAHKDLLAVHNEAPAFHNAALAFSANAVAGNAEQGRDI